MMANLRLAPPLPIVPEHLQGKPIVALIATYAGPIDDGRAALAPIRRASHPGLRRRDAQAVRRPTRRCSTPPTPTAGTTTGSRTSSARSPTRSSTWSSTMPPGSPRRSPPCRSSASEAPWPGCRRRRRPSRTVTPPTTSTSWRRGCPTRPVTPTATSSGCGRLFDALEPYSRGVYVNFTSDDARRAGTPGLQRPPVGPAHRPQGQVRPDQLLPDERQHPGRIARRHQWGRDCPTAVALTLSAVAPSKRSAAATGGLGRSPSRLWPGVGLPCGRWRPLFAAISR